MFSEWCKTIRSLLPREKRIKNHPKDFVNYYSTSPTDAEFWLLFHRIRHQNERNYYKPLNKTSMSRFFSQSIHCTSNVYASLVQNHFSSICVILINICTKDGFCTKRKEYCFKSLQLPAFTTRSCDVSRLNPLRPNNAIEVLAASLHLSGEKRFAEEACWEKT